VEYVWKFLTVIGSWIKAGASHEHGNVIGVTGPIGVGKTTLIKEGLAKALGRPFYFISLGGTSYSAFLQGHGYTYEGSTYGEIVRGVIESGCMDPVFYFDELDKVATDGKGDEVIHALIHLTDPAQNDQFSDRYFAGIDIDVSKALFIFSYNHREKVNPILRDRIHEIVLEDFTLSEKTDIATKYVLPKISKGMSLELDPLLTFADGCIEHLVDLCEESTGMRTLKMVLVRMLRILNLAEMSDGELVLNVDKTLVTGKAPYTVTKDLIDELYKFCESTEKAANVSNSMMYM
jgi:ATP-dependent Lon protease